MHWWYTWFPELTTEKPDPGTGVHICNPSSSYMHACNFIEERKLFIKFCRRSCCLSKIRNRFLYVISGLAWWIWVLFTVRVNARNQTERNQSVKLSQTHLRSIYYEYHKAQSRRKFMKDGYNLICIPWTPSGIYSQIRCTRDTISKICVWCVRDVCK